MNTKFLFAGAILRIIRLFHTSKVGKIGVVRFEIQLGWRVEREAVVFIRIAIHTHEPFLRVATSKRGKFLTFFTVTLFVTDFAGLASFFHDEDVNRVSEQIVIAT